MSAVGQMQAVNRTRTGEICWTDLGAKDLDAQTRFYESMFGWTHEDIPTDIGPIYRMFRLSGLVVAAASTMPPDQLASGRPSAWNVYIATEDADEIARRASELGGQVIMPAMDVMDQGRMLGVADPTGGAVFFWQAGAHKGAEVFGAKGSLAWADLSTPDPDRAVDFFARLVGWTAEKLTGAEIPYWQISVDGAREGGIMPMPPGAPPEMPAAWLPYFAVESAPDAVERAARLGATVEAPPMQAGGVTFAILSDPAGATFGVSEPMG